MPIYQPSQILDIKPNPDKFISAKTQTNINALRVQENQILLTCSGTIGKCTIVSKTLKNKIFSHDLIRIQTNNQKDTGYIYTYLKTKIGQIVLTTNNYGVVIQHIEPEHLENVPIPNAPENIKKEIHEKVMRSFALRDESNELLEKAEKLLTEALKLPDIDSLKPDLYKKDAGVQTFTVKLDMLNDRFEGSYHVPIAAKIIDCLLDSGAKILPLGSSELTSKIYIPNRFKRIYLEEGENGVPFFSGKCVHELDPTNKKFISASLHKDRIGKQLLIKENMLLITCSGTTGKVNIVPKHWHDWVMTHDIIRVVPIQEFSGYLYVWLNSEFGNLLIKRYDYGSVVPHIESEHAISIPIPILQDTQKIKEINDLALKANKLRSEAYYLEQEAIKQMNEEVIYAKNN